MRTQSIFAISRILPRPIPMWSMLALFGLLMVNSAGGDERKVPAQGADTPASAPSESPLPSTVPPEIIKPVAPKKLESAESVFRELDVNKRGYVTREDTKDLLGFEDAFRAVDKRNSGRLTLNQFRRAWSIYKQP
jgi:hypothetical protein